MTSSEDVKKLAALARIRVDDAELEKFTKEFDAILAYVGQLDALNIDTKAPKAAPPLRNVFREDGEPHEKGIYTEKLAEQFPSSAKATEGKPEDGVYLEVKQIISHD
jgi:aspartyl-tRNA(Asn)/glutamyl-tRNA(Gln) amidotransferase subunit C